MKNKVKLTLSIDKELLREFKDYCKKEGLIISRQVEKFIEEKLKKK
jgi:post-segregation antitoxin (ccd killing protein)